MNDRWSRWMLMIRFYRCLAYQEDFGLLALDGGNDSRFYGGSSTSSHHSPEDNPLRSPIARIADIDRPPEPERGQHPFNNPQTGVSLHFHLALALGTVTMLTMHCVIANRSLFQARTKN